MDKEFNLSNKINNDYMSEGSYERLEISDVKKFIKELKQVIPKWIKPDGINKDDLHKKIDNLAGDKLNGR